jgi:hypothetical protein
LHIEAQSGQLHVNVISAGEGNRPVFAWQTRSITLLENGILVSPLAAALVKEFLELRQRCPDIREESADLLAIVDLALIDLHRQPLE